MFTFLTNRQQFTGVVLNFKLLRQKFKVTDLLNDPLTIERPGQSNDQLKYEISSKVFLPIKSWKFFKTWILVHVLQKQLISPTLIKSAPPLAYNSKQNCFCLS